MGDKVRRLSQRTANYLAKAVVGEFALHPEGSSLLEERETLTAVYVSAAGDHALAEFEGILFLCIGLTISPLAAHRSFIQSESNRIESNRIESNRIE